VIIGCDQRFNQTTGLHWPIVFSGVLKGPYEMPITKSRISVLLIFTCAGGGLGGAVRGAMPKEAANELFW
jgi:hypothetical protein